MARVIKFGEDFELDLGACELRRAGKALRLARIPMELLQLLLEQPGQLVTREEIAGRVWGKDVFLDTDNGINAVIRRIRQVLEDDPEQPRFIQTVIGRGYRFIASIEQEAATAALIPRQEAEQLLADEVRVPAHARPKLAFGIAVLALVVAAVIAGGWGLQRIGRVDSIAVLPFVSASSDEEVEYLSDGITEGIINDLSKLPHMRVMSRSTVFRYKGHESDPQRAGRQMAVRAVLTGTLVRHGDDVRVQTELVDVTNGTILWGEQYNRKLSDIAAVQEEVAEDVSVKLKVRLSGDDRNRLKKRNTESWEAYDLYLRGRYQWNKFSMEGTQKAVDYFEQAIEKDPTFALAYAGLADAYHEMASIEPRDTMPRAMAAANRALELDDSVAEAHAALGWVKWKYDWDWSGAEKEFRRAIELDPKDAIAHGMYALYLDSMSRSREAEAEHKRAQELDPLSLILSTNRADALYYLHRYDEAIAQYEKTLEMDPSFVPAVAGLAEGYDSKGMHAEAIAEWRKYLALEGDPRTGNAIAQAYTRFGYKAAMQVWLKRLTSPVNHEYVSPLFVATIYARIGDADSAFVWLKRACQERDGDLVHIEVERSLDGLRADARFHDIERRIGLPGTGEQDARELLSRTRFSPLQ